MDSVEFVKNIENGAQLFISHFDSIMALYDLMHKFSGLKLINNSTEAEVRFKVKGEQQKLEEVIDYVNTYQVTGYGIFSGDAYMDGDDMVITLQQVT